MRGPPAAFPGDDLILDLAAVGDGPDDDGRLLARLFHGVGQLAEVRGVEGLPVLLRVGPDLRYRDRDDALAGVFGLGLGARDSGLLRLAGALVGVAANQDGLSTTHLSLRFDQ